MKRFNKALLEENNGENSQPILVAYNGKVYDLTTSPRWRNGKHMGVHNSGNDLTSSLTNAPHNAEVFKKFDIVGDFEKEVEKKETYWSFSRRLIPHPMIVHFPIAYSIIVPLLSILYLITGVLSFEAASYYVLVFGFLSSPVCSFSGFASWIVAFKGKRRKEFNRKIFLSIGLLLVISICTVWRTLNPNVLITGNIFSYLFLIFEICLAVIVSILGHIGGKIAFSM